MSRAVRRVTPRLLGALLALVVTAGMLALAAPAAAGEPCWQTVINDWADNTRVDGRYPIHCYRDALRNLPEDMRAYSSAPDDIERAMRAEMLRQAGGSPSTSTDDSGALGGSGSGGSPGSGEDAQQGQSAPYQGFGGDPDPDDDRDESGGILRQALDEIGPGDATSFPLPLLVLGGLLGVFLIAGGLGYLARRGAPGRLRTGRR
jgi:hypothetical protein